MLKNSRVLITGATGFIGANLLRRCLKEGAQVCILACAGSANWRIADVKKEAVEYEVDVRDYARLENVVSKVRPEIVFHLAAYGVYPFQSDNSLIMNTNVLGTANLLNACRKNGFKRFVATGTAVEYGVKSSPLVETDLLEPVTDYGVSKAASTLLCQAVGRREDLPITILRLFTPFGDFEEKGRLISTVITSCLKKRALKLAVPGFVRDFSYISDVVDAFINVADNSNSAGNGEIYNIANGREYTIGQAVEIMLKLLNSKIKPEWGSLAPHGVKAGVQQADISKAGRVLNWSPKYSFEQGLSETIKWFEKNISLYTE